MSNCHHESTAGPLTRAHDGNCRFCQTDDGPTLRDVRHTFGRPMPETRNAFHGGIVDDSRYLCRWNGCRAEAEVSIGLGVVVCGTHADLIADLEADAAV